ncbi:hypothetical protein ACJZ2D_013574 [Fusarium nematophilum]
MANHDILQRPRPTDSANNRATDTISTCLFALLLPSALTGPRTDILAHPPRVKEFLKDQFLKPKIDGILLNWPDESVKYDSMHNGHIFHLNLAAVALRLPKNAKAQSLWELGPMETVIQHAPKAERLSGRSLFPLLNSLDYICLRTSTQGERWVTDYISCKDATLVPTFLAFCVWSNMQFFVADALSHDESRIFKHGRPLLHFAGWVPGGFPLPKIAQILLRANDDPNWDFDENLRHDRSKTALESIRYGILERDGQSHCDYIKLLISNDANITRQTGEGWITVLHEIAGMSVGWDKKMDIIRTIPRHVI